jgi:hypothetical protein
MSETNDGNTFARDAMLYARFLQDDKGIPLHFGVWLAGFMLMAKTRKFFESPRIWVAQPDPELGITLTRVYFRPWSQNKLPAIRYASRFHFCPVDQEIFLDYWCSRRQLSMLRLTRLDYSGARTREAVDDAQEGVAWLRSQLDATS